MLLHNYSTRSHLRKEIFNAKSLVSIFVRRCLSTSPETSASEVVVERKGNIHQLLVPIVGSERASWKESLRKFWDYVKVHSLQDTVNRKEINCDTNLSSLFDGKTKILQTEVMKGLGRYITYDPITKKEKSILSLDRKKAREAKVLKELDSAQQATQQESPKEATKKKRNSKAAALSGTEKLVEKASIPDEVADKTIAKKKSTRTRAKKASPVTEEAIEA